MRLEVAGEGRREIKVRMAGPENGRDAKRETEYLLSELSEGQRVLIGLYAVLHFALQPRVRRSASTNRTTSLPCHEVQPWLAKVLERTEHDQSPAKGC